MKKYIKTEKLNLVGKEIETQYLVVEVDEKVVEVNDINEILTFIRKKYDPIGYINQFYTPTNNLTNEELLYKLLTDNRFIKYKDYLNHHFADNEQYQVEN